MARGSVHTGWLSRILYFREVVHVSWCPGDDVEHDQYTVIKFSVVVIPAELNIALVAILESNSPCVKSIYSIFFIQVLLKRQRVTFRLVRSKLATGTQLMDNIKGISFRKVKRSGRFNRRHGANHCRF